MSLLFNLPDMLVVGTLTSWVNVADLGRLDTATCNKFEREHYLNLVSEPTFVIQNPWKDADNPSDMFVKWIIKRQVAVSALAMTGTLLSSRSERQKYLKHCGKHIRSVDVRDVPEGSEICTELFRDLCENCPNVTEAGCDEDLPPGAQAHIAAHWKQLTVLHIELGVAGEELVSLGENCQSLEKLTVWGSSEALHHVPVTFFEICSPRLSELTAGELLIPAHYKALATRCPNLTKLTVRDGTLDDDALLAVGAGCRALKQLRLYGIVDVTDTSLVAIARNGALTELFIDGSPNITDAGLEAVAECCPQLEVVSLALCEQFTDTTVVALGQHCPNLRKLNICHTATTDEGGESISSNCPLLEEVDLASCGQLRDDTLIALGYHCSMLRELNIENLYMTDYGLRAIGEGCPLLEVLRADNCELVGAAMEAIARGCPSLHVLSANRTFMPAAAVLALAECCPLLASFELACCDAVGDKELTALVRGCKALRILTISGTSATVLGVRAIKEYCTDLRMIELEKHMLPAEDAGGRFFPPAIYVRLGVVTYDEEPSEEESMTSSSDYSTEDEVSLSGWR
jgi:hypothetical protein